MAAASGKRLGKVLDQAGIATQEQIDEALVTAESSSLAAALIANGVSTDSKIAQAVADLTGEQLIEVFAQLAAEGFLLWGFGEMHTKRDVSGCYVGI